MRMFRRNKKGIYIGAVAFVEGFHYPVVDGHPVTRQPLAVEMHDGREVFVWGTSKSPMHNHVYERNVVEITPFSEDQPDG